jgi:2-polyprenyl-3-methyl-5-hydroxy-6-metoxy-1,4-benzoquinol methylase
MENLHSADEILQFDDAAGKLLEALEKKDSLMKDFVISRFKGVSFDPVVEEKTYNHMLEISSILSAMASNPGTSIFTEFLYNGIYSPLPGDSYVLESRAGRAVRSRLESVEANLFEIFEKNLQEKKNLLIGNFGSGPGRDTINVLSHHYRGRSGLKAIHIDRDRAAINRGIVMAKNRGLDDIVEFSCQSFMKYCPEEKFDIVVLVGVLCSLDFETCVNVLSTIKRTIKSGGLIIASNATPAMKDGDPFAYFLMNWLANWKLEFKNTKIMKKIFEKSGYAWQGSFTEKFGFHLMGVGVSI